VCGITGIISKKEDIDPSFVRRMASVLVHRGPEYTGYYFSKQVGMAHTRLSIIDIKGGNQPLYDWRQEIVLIANGEIYNFVELKQYLIGKGYNFKTNSDCETIIYAYQHFGDTFIKHIYGMFAFALFDMKREKLILARDRLGIKPLFYIHLPGKAFIFSSEIKALLSLPYFQLDINKKALSEFFCNQFYTGRDTIFSHIYKVMPGEILTVDKNINLSHRIYWSLTNVEQRSILYDKAVEEFSELFTTVLKQHLRSDVPYGIFLSGGVDSATVLSMVDRYQSNPVMSFSVGYKDVEMKDETKEAQYIASLFKTRHHAIVVDPSTLLKRLPYTFWCIDDLMRDYASLPTIMLSETASKKLKVVLTGEGGDEVFAGYGRYRGAIKRRIRSILYKGGGFRHRSSIDLALLNKIFIPEMKSYLSLHQEPFIQKWKETNPSWSVLNKYQYIDITTALPDNLLVKVDRTTMGFSLEARVPFLDHRIVEFGISLPDNLKTRGREGKYFLKEWASKYLPRSHLYRKKSGFGVPVGEIFSPQLIKEIRPRLKKNQGIRNWFKWREIEKTFLLRDKKERGRVLWSLVQFAAWFNIFVEKRGEKRPAVKDNILEWI